LKSRDVARAVILVAIAVALWVCVDPYGHLPISLVSTWSTYLQR
jgi:hypothetical protein